MKILISSIVDLKRTAHNRLHQFVKYLSQEHEITVISIDDHWKAKQTDVGLYSQDFNNVLNNIKIEYLTNSGLSPILQEMTAGFSTQRILDKIGYRDFDVHLNYSSLISGYFISRKMKAIGVNTVYDIADDLPAMVRDSPQIPFALKPIAGLVSNFFFKQNILNSVHITCIAESLLNTVNLPLPGKTIIPNGADTTLFRSLPAEKLKQQLEIEDSFVIGYVGVLREWVNLEPVFAAINGLQTTHNLKLLIVGDEGGLIKNKQLAEKYKITENILFAGTIPYTTVPEYIACMDICLVPFKKGAIAENSLPLKLLEYMACGKPVIATPLTGIKQAVTKHVLYATDKDEIKQAIERLYDNSGWRIKMGEDGKQFVINNYAWHNMCAKLDKVLANAARIR